MSDRRIKFVGVFPSKFPGWGGDTVPVKHRRLERGEDGTYEPTGEEYVCDMPFHAPSGICMSVRYCPVGVSAVDANGDCWVLVQDFSIGIPRKDLRWVRFPVEVAE